MFLHIYVVLMYNGQNVEYTAQLRDLEFEER